MDKRNCFNHPNKFCYICGDIIMLNRKANFTVHCLQKLSGLFRSNPWRSEYKSCAA